MTAPARDPRWDPKPGDVLSKPHIIRAVCRHQPYPGKMVDCWLRNAEGWCIGYSQNNLGQWRKWAKDAEVIHAAS